MPQHPSAPADVTSMGRSDASGGLDLMLAIHRTHTFPRHFHETYVVQVVESGVDKFYCRGALHEAGAGSVVCLNPSEVHTGGPAHGQVLRYRSFYLQTRYLAEVASDLGGSGQRAPEFHHCVISDPTLAARLAQVHAAIQPPTLRIEAEERLLDGATALLAAVGYGRRVGALRREDGAVRVACEYLRANVSGQPSLDDLAAQTRLSRFHLLRVFRRATGLPPHQYLLNLRIEQARVLLRRGVPPAQVAASVGFADQSHLNRYFKRHIGITPGRYAQSNIVQDRVPASQ
ncbi:AraC family transcriptional regulator [Gemmata sp. G18]|uniref:AraC family transcriptional regulator n=1 Tax=Gemmata palustris TaxID=2822762 RepID=A0ABS5BJ79_9BACT|nr:AraC family transcriptional regulator [Gemmata palustris]MBP3953752.1 AraC family transcriptional regulator [Gemmata palustris]